MAKMAWRERTNYSTGQDNGCVGRQTRQTSSESKTRQPTSGCEPHTFHTHKRITVQGQLFDAINMGCNYQLIRPDPRRINYNSQLAAATWGGASQIWMGIGCLKISFTPYTILRGPSSPCGSSSFLNVPHMVYPRSTKDGYVTTNYATL